MASRICPARGCRPSVHAANNVGNRTLADVQAEDLRHQLLQALVGDVLHMLQIGHQRLDARAEGALRLQTRWVLGLLVVITMWAINLVAAGLDDHRPHRRYLHHLTGADFSAGQIGQVGAAIIAVGGPTLQRNVRLLTAAGVALMALLRATFALPGAVAIGLAAL
jgi:hypothetical protein